MRAEQLGPAIGASVKWRAVNVEQFRGIDVLVYVKRLNDGVLAAIRESGRPWVWDIVDAWPRPADNNWDRQHSVIWLQGELRRLKPSAIIVATHAMLEDSGWSGKSLVLPHHAWSKYSPRPLAESVLQVGYEGMPLYLGKWKALIDAECAKRGWSFVVGDLSNADIGIALRDDRSYANKFWKSNCKLANLQALGIPAICSPEAGYVEFGSGEELIVEKKEQLVGAFDRLASMQERGRIRERMLAAAPRIDAVAREYSEWLALNF